MPLKNSSKNGKRSLLRQQVLIVAITLTAVAVVILLSRRAYHETREMATEQFNQQQLILARSAATGIEGYYKELSETLSSLAQLPSIQRMAPECLRCMQHTYWGFPPRTSLRLLDSDGLLRFIYPFDAWRGELVGRDYGGEAYFQEARETGRTSVSGLIINEQEETRIRIAVPVYLTHKTETIRIGDEAGITVTPIDPSEPGAGEFQGVLVGSFDLQTIGQDFISPIVSGKTGYAWLLNEAGIFLAHHEEGFTGRSGFEVRAEKNPDVSYKTIEQIQQRMMAGEEGVGCYVSGRHRGQIGEIKKLIAYTPVHINGNVWSVAVCAPVSEVEEIVQVTKRTEQYTLGFVILALTAGGLALFTTSYRWSCSLEQEVTRRTRELRETSDYLSSLIRYANAPIIVWNPDRQVAIFNQAFEKMSGRTEAEMMGQPLDVLFPEESRSDCLHKIESASRGEYWETVEIPILRQDGEIRLGLWNSANIYGEDGKTLIATVAQGQDITGRKRAEEALRESRDAYRATFETTGTAMLISEEDTTISMINAEFEKLCGYSKEEVEGKKSWIEFIVKADLERMKGHHRLRMIDPNAAPPYYEFQFIDKHGNVKDVFITLALIPGTKKTVGSLLDITEHKAAEEALQESEERHRALFETAQNAIFLSDETGRFVDVNQAACESLGYSKEELLKLSNREIDADPRGYEAFLKVRNGLAKTITFEVNQRRKDGTLLPMEITGSFFTSGGQRLSLAIARDITERKRAEEALRESEERYRAISELTSDIAYAVRVEPNGTTVREWVTGALPRITGFTPDELRARGGWKSLMHPDDMPIAIQHLQCHLPGQPDVSEYRIVTKSGETRWLRDYGYPVWDEDQGRVVRIIGAAQDITERKQAEEALRRSLERTSRGQRLLLALSQAAQAVQRARTPDEVYRTVADEVARLGYRAAIFTLTDDQAHLTVPHLTFGPALLQAAEKLTGLSAQDYRFPLALGGFFERIIAEGETTFVERTTEAVAEALPGSLRPLASRLAALLGIERSILAPLTVGGERHGLLAVLGADLTEADVPTVTGFATQAAIAIENAWLFEEVRAGREQLRNLASYLQTAREEERAYVAREIHDEFGQALTALKMDLAWLTKRLPADKPRLAEKTSAMSGLIDSTIQTVRRVATELRPGLLDDLGLAAAIEWLAQELAERTRINCELYLGDEDIVLDRDLATAIFRIFQEALTNVARHAGATEVQVKLEEGPDELLLTIRDNGKGITPSQVSDPHSLGLIGMRERAHSWGGDVTFQSAPEQGTIVTVRVPR